MSATQGKRVEKKEEERGRDELERKGKYLVSEGVFSSVRAIGNDFGPCERLQGGGKEWKKEQAQTTERELLNGPTRTWPDSRTYFLNAGKLVS